MSTIHLLRIPAGFVPATDEDAEACRRFRTGSVVRFEASAMRNGRFFRKWWVLSEFAFGLWSERQKEGELWHGLPVLADFDRFRRDLTILAGFARPVWNARGELRVEAESLAWGSMSEERFEKLYSATINAILSKILPKAGLTEERLRQTVDQLVGEFA